MGIVPEDAAAIGPQDEGVALVLRKDAQHPLNAVGHAAGDLRAVQ